MKALAGEHEGSLGADHSMATIRPGNTVLHLNSHLHLWGNFRGLASLGLNRKVAFGHHLRIPHLRFGVEII